MRGALRDETRPRGSSPVAVGAADVDVREVVVDLAAAGLEHQERVAGLCCFNEKKAGVAFEPPVVDSVYSVVRRCGLAARVCVL